MSQISGQVDNNDLCAICQAELGVADDDPTLALVCGHTLHRECVERYAEIIHSSLEQLRCPNRRLNSEDIVARQSVDDIVGGPGDRA